jgi:hypothetical protein
MIIGIVMNVIPKLHHTYSANSFSSNVQTRKRNVRISCLENMGIVTRGIERKDGRAVQVRASHLSHLLCVYFVKKYRFHVGSINMLGF